MYKKHVTYDMPVLEMTSTPVKGTPIYTFDVWFRYSIYKYMY